MASLNPPSAPPALALSIRFSASIADLDLDISHPAQTTVISLKHLIRSRLSEPNSKRRLRFILGGKILPDHSTLSSVLRAPAPPPPTSSSSSAGPGRDSHEGDPKAKGKGVANRAPTPRIYINCGIGDHLTDEELRLEAQAASKPAAELPAASWAAPSELERTTPLRSTSNAPRGFDRLLAAGFSTAEVNQLRLQFRSIHSARYTPDTLPSPDSFRRLEDSWIDDNGAANTVPGMGGATAGGFESDDVGIAGHIDALVLGVCTGFMWPLGSLMWLGREPGIHSDRWNFMIFVGLLFSFVIGVVRAISGDR